ncbi:MAG TPA: tail fiber domain-containing protein, partial [Chitinispirillaceae bacterium]|nr:tail fiber domain-containing protein [Chitinispirillaceae bacterium]
MKKQILTIVILTFVISTYVTGSIPKTLSYQGVVTDSNGNPKNDGKYDFVFSIYDDSVSGKSLWSEEKTIQTKQGLFSTELGSVEPLTIPFDTQYWLQVEADGTVFPQRTKLTGAPYSFRADTAQIAKGMVDSYYTREQLRDSGEAKVHAGNIENSPWIKSKEGLIWFDKGTDKHVDSLSTYEGVRCRTTEYGTPLSNVSVINFNPTNDLNGNYDAQLAWSYSSSNRFWLRKQRDVDKGIWNYPWCELWHSENLNPDYLVKGETIRCSYNYSEKNPLDSNNVSAFYAIQENDPSNPPFNAYGIHISSASADGYGLDIIGRGNQDEIYWSGLDKYKRSPWRKIWHSGNLNPETQSSDIRFKTDIDSIHDPLKKVNALKGISFNWKHSDFPDRHFPEGRQIGVIAQEVE